MELTHKDFDGGSRCAPDQLEDMVAVVDDVDVP